MSDETYVEPNRADLVDSEAPAERDPSPHAASFGAERVPGRPPRGAALSVLWWLEGEPDGRG